MKNEKLKTFLGILGIYIILIIIISPFKEFPLNDDWVHSLIIRDYLAGNGFHYSSWLSSNLHFNILYGIGLSELFGFSFFILRISNIIFSFFSVFIFYLILNELSVKRYIKYILIVLFIFNPIFLNLSFTFMGDVSSLFLIILSIYLYYLGFKCNNNFMIFLSTIISVIGIFIRQISILLIFSSLIYYIYKYGKKGFIKSLSIYGIPGVITLVVYIVLNYYRYLPGEVSARFLKSGIFITAINNVWTFLLLLTLFILPLTISLIVKNAKSFFNKQFLVIFITFIIIGVFQTYQGIDFLHLGNIISIHGIGPSSDIMQGNISAWGNKYIYIIINLILIFCLPFNLYLAKRYNKEIFANKDYNFIYIFAFLYLLLITPIYAFDRYLLVILPILLLALGVILQNFKFSKIFIIILLIVMATYSTIGTYNYLKWNESRWELGNKLLKSGVDARDIEGGYEFNGWNDFKEGEAQIIGNFTPKWAPWYVKRLSQGHLMKYIISFSELGGYKVIEKKKVNGLFSNFDYIYANVVIPKK